MNGVNSNAINFAGYADSKSFFELCNHFKPNIKTWSKSGITIICVTACVAAVVMFYAAYSAGNISILVPILLGVVVPIVTFVPVSKLSTKQNIKIQRLNYEKAVQKESRTGSISTSGVFFKIADGKTELQWTHFDRLVEIDGAFALCKQSSMVDAFSCSMFESKENFEAARKIALEKVKGVQ
jgi:hypothetical protein